MWRQLLHASSKAALIGAESPGSDDEDDSESDDNGGEHDEEAVPEDPAYAVARAAHAAGVVAGAVECYGGARVEDYEPIFSLLTHKLLPALEVSRTAAAAGELGERGDAAAGLLVRRCRLTSSKPVLKAPTVSALEARIR
jgi:hypothetical protein